MIRILLIVTLIMPSLVQADTLRIPVGQQGYSQVSLPRYGDSKSSVLERFGLADVEHPSIGQPPITRWDYRDFSVYFEYDHVVNSVRHHSTRLHNKEQQ